MKKTLTTYDIADALLDDEYGGWSKAGAFAMAEYLEELESDCGMEIELDVVAIRCDYSEYASLRVWIAEYYGKPLETAIKSAGIDLEGEEDDEEVDDLIREYIHDHGYLVEFTGGIIVSIF